MIGMLRQKLFTTLKQPFYDVADRKITFFSKSNSRTCPYRVISATRNDIGCIIDLMKEAYYLEEPTCMSLGLGPKHYPVLFVDPVKAMMEGLTVVAKCKYNSKILGACINCTTCEWNPDEIDDFADTTSSTQLKQFFHFFAHLQRVPSLWEQYDASKIFEIAYLFVKASERGQGLGGHLLEASRDLGADCGYTVIRVDATSYYTAKICEKLNFKLVYEIPYSSYLGPDNEPVFKPPPPHNSVKVYVDNPHAKLCAS